MERLGVTYVLDRHVDFLRVWDSPLLLIALEKVGPIKLSSGKKVRRKPGNINKKINEMKWTAIIYSISNEILLLRYELWFFLLSIKCQVEQFFFLIFYPSERVQ